MLMLSVPFPRYSSSWMGLLSVQPVLINTLLLYTEIEGGQKAGDPGTVSELLATGKVKSRPSALWLS